MPRNYENALCGIYKIACCESGKFYIGSSSHVESRLSSHKSMLRAGKHHSNYMQNSWDKYGEDSFNFELVLLCDEENLLFYEAELVDKLYPAFNSAPVLWDGDATGYRKDLIEKAKEVARKNRPQYQWEGEMLSLIAIAEKTGVEHDLLISRIIGLNMDVETAVAQPKRIYKWVVEYNGVRKHINEWAKELGCHAKRLQSRLVKGIPFDEIYDEIVKSNKRLSFSEFFKIGGVNLKTATSRRKSGKSLMECLEGGANG